MKNHKAWLYLALSLASTLVVASLVGVGAYFFGRFQGFRDGMQFVTATRQLDRPAESPTTSDDAAAPAAKPRFFGAPRGHPGANHPAPPGARPGKAPPAHADADELGLPTITGEEEDLSGQMAQLDQMLSKLMPDSAVPPPKPSAQTLAMIKKGSKDDAQAVAGYLKQVQAIMDAGGSLSSQDLASGLQAGDDKTYAKAIGELEKSYEKLKGLTVPPSCVELQASYLTLVPDLRSLFALQRRARDEADMSLMLESLSLAKRVMSMQKQVQRLQGQLQGAQKG